MSRILRSINRADSRRATTPSWSKCTEKGGEVFDLVDQALLRAEQIDLVMADQGTHRITPVGPGVGAVARQVEAQVVGGGVEGLGLHGHAQAQQQNGQPPHGRRAAGPPTRRR
jgi:hypothetical protein